MDLLTTVLDVFLPHHCLLCNQQNVNARLCQGCRRDLPWLGPACRRCALPLPMAVESCGHCLSKSPSFDYCRAAFCYASPVDRLIGQLKNQGRLSAGRLLCDLLVDGIHASAAPTSMPDLIAPVPLHWQRQLKRGFNQASFIAERLAGELNIRLTAIAKRHHATPKQQQLNRKQRLQNLRNAFVIDAARVADRHVVIVDDVITTGATAEALSRQLKQAGARQVDVWALARTPAPASP